MRGIYHYCFSSPGEVICRDDEDYNRFVNCYALALYRTGAESLADAVMSNHFHAVLVCEDMVAFSGLLRNMYTRYFNIKYGRRGKLGEKRSYWGELQGVKRVCTAVSYVLRNPVHHGVCNMVFGYKYSSVRCLFAKEMGYGFYSHKCEDFLDRTCYRFYVAKNVKCPDHYVLDSDGCVLRKCFTNVAQSEILYGSVRNFIFQMTRFSGEEWIQEQLKESPTLKPVTLADIEMPLLKGNHSGVSHRDSSGVNNLSGVNHGDSGGVNNLSGANRKFVDCDLDKGLKILYNNERMRHERSMVQDIDLCRLIDDFVVRVLGKISVYALDDEDRRAVVRYLKSEPEGKRFLQEQLRRCLFVQNGR